MKKIKDFFAKITRDEFKVNAFYDVGLKILFLIAIVSELFGLYSFFLSNPFYSLFFLDIGIAILLFIVLFGINSMKRKKNNHTENFSNKNSDISRVLSIIGGLCFLLVVFLSPKNIPLLLVSAILMIGSIAFYMIGYKQARKKLHYEKIA